MEGYTEKLRRIESGERLTLIGGHELTRETVEGWIDNACEIIDVAISKVIFYREAIEKLGGITYNAENIKPGYIVDIGCHAVEVTSTGKTNIKGVVRGGGADGWPVTAAYAEIKQIIKAEEKKKPAQPWKVGEKITVEKYDCEQRGYVPIEFEVVKASETSLTLASRNGEKIVRRPTYRPSYGQCGFVRFLTVLTVTRAA